MTNNKKSGLKQEISQNAFVTEEAERARDDQAQVVQQKYDELKKKYTDLKFGCCIGGFILFDAWSMTNIQSSGGCLVILVLELIALFLLGKKYDIEEINLLVDKILNALKK